MTEVQSPREAQPNDVELLIEMMAEFYAEASYPLNRVHARQAFEGLLNNSALGSVWILQKGAEAAGYLVLTLTYSMEYGGLAAFIDDLYVRPEHRGQGIGYRGMEAIRQHAAGLGVRAIHLEVGADNARAQSLYRKAGFVPTGRQLLTLQLASPTHLL
ncbi:MAG TPA: GNAT family N-acetyltransferase [Longimicrobiales bacterium]